MTKLDLNCYFSTHFDIIISQHLLLNITPNQPILAIRTNYLMLTFVLGHNSNGSAYIITECFCSPGYCIVLKRLFFHLFQELSNYNVTSITSDAFLPLISITTYAVIKVLCQPRDVTFMMTNETSQIVQPPIHFV